MKTPKEWSQTTEFKSFELLIENVQSDAQKPIKVKLDYAKSLLVRCLDTGSLRTDTTRQLWDAINEFLKGETK